tara:strand:+ start:298 stop:729 length:432 start_codon:yes stop_codon:yes gene_type:complete
MKSNLLQFPEKCRNCGELHKMELNGEIGWGTCLPPEISFSMFLEKLHKMGCNPKLDMAEKSFERAKYKTQRNESLKKLFSEATGMTRELLSKITVGEDFFEIHPMDEQLLQKDLSDRIRDRYKKLTDDTMVIIVVDSNNTKEG